MICVMNIDVAIGAIRDAFDPLSCSIEVYDYQKQLRFQVFGPDQKRVLSILSISMRDIVDPSILRAELQLARALLKGKGFRLKPWTVPNWGRYTVRANPTNGVRRGLSGLQWLARTGCSHGLFQTSAKPGCTSPENKPMNPSTSIPPPSGDEYSSCTNALDGLALACATKGLCG